MRTPRVVSIGEVLWDLLPSGPQLGGAPANLAGHLHALHNDVTLVSRVGSDSLGAQAREILGGRGLDLSGLQTDPNLPTGTVGVEVDSQGQPSYCIHEGVAWDALELVPEASSRVQRADAVVFGTLAQRANPSRDTIRRLVTAAPLSSIRICDLNLRDPFHGPDRVAESCRMATIVKLNNTELDQLASWFGWKGSVESQTAALAEAFQLEEVILTLGHLGSCVWCSGEWLTRRASTVTVVDTVGAGDAFTAAYLSSRLRGRPLPETLRLASDIAAYVCTQPGGLPVLPDALTRSFRGTGPSEGVDPGSTRT
ncbi:MAG: 5-dehydro-2-deoxygluconokinase [Verrucomicrobiota bacterium]|jgi:fructokinase